MVIAKQINKLTGRKGRVFKERYHARVLRSPTEVMLSRRYILNNFRKHLAQRLATERTQPQAAHICVTPKHLDIARQILAAPAGSIHIRRRAAWQPGALRCPTGPSNCSGGPGSNALAQAKGPRRAATKAAREPDRSVVVLREDRKRSANERGRDGSGLPLPGSACCALAVVLPIGSALAQSANSLRIKHQFNRLASCVPAHKRPPRRSSRTVTAVTGTASASHEALERDLLLTY